VLIDVTYFAQAMVATGCAHEQVEASTLGELLRAIHERHGSAVDELICDEHGELVPWIVVDLNGEAVGSPEQSLANGDSVRFLSPISGG
jgi:molybdopterin converting factor small subunit